MAIRSRWATQFEVIEGNSKFHERVRQILATNEFFRRLRCFQEVPVKDLCPDYPSVSHRIDWYIEDLNLIVELHGAQHYILTNRGNVPAASAQREFQKSKARDSRKQQALEDADYEYLVIPYKEYAKLDAERLTTLILK